jgi:cation diffusion facilitator family transporter
MNQTKKEIALIRTTTLICFLFGVAGVAMAVVTRSRSMLFDGMYSFIQSIFILCSASIVRLIGRGDNREYQFGYGAFEPFFIVVRTIALLCMNIFLAWGAVTSILDGGYRVRASAAILFTAISVIVCAVIWRILVNTSRKENSPVLKAEAKSWLNDTLISCAVLASFVVMAVLDRTPFAWLSSFADPAITILFIGGMTPTLVGQLVTNTRELLDAAPPMEIQQGLEDIVQSHVQRHGFKSFQAYSTKRGRTISTIIHVQLKQEMPLRQLDMIRKNMLRDIKKFWQWSDTDIVFTIDPSWIPLSAPVFAEEQRTQFEQILEQAQA